MPLATAPSLPVSAKVARFAVLGAACALLALVLLHILRPDLSPRSRMISEYAVGRHGWLMTLSFEAFAVGSFALAVAAFSRVRAATGRAGLVFLALAGVGAALGGAFPIDPTTSDPEKMSFSGHMHGLGFMLGVPSELLAVLLLAIAARKVEAWSAPATRRSLVALAALAWASLGVMVALLFVGHDFGIPNRAFMTFFGLFVLVAARAIALEGPERCALR